VKRKARYDAEADAYYLPLATIGAGEAVAQKMIKRKHGYVILDFDAKGRLLGVEVIGARKLLRSQTLKAAKRIDR
jgi:uncharacterized protein YuzE